MKERFFMGGDVSKGYTDFTILDNEENIVEGNFQLDDTYQGHQNVKDIFKEFFSKHSNSELYVGFESTGGYENNWLNLMWNLKEDYNIHVAKINAKAVYHHKESDLKRVITDDISAKSIAEYLLSKRKKIVFNQQDPYAELKRQWKFIRLLKKQKTQLLNHLEKLIYNAHPQLISYCKDGMSDWVLHLIKKYPTALRLSKASVSGVSLIPYISKDKARELIKKAKSSVSSASSSAFEVIISTLSRKILDTEKIIKAQMKIIEESNKFEEIKILNSFIGISDFSAYGLMIEIGNIQRFHSVKSLASFFGLHPTFKDSGDGHYEVRMSKVGRKEPRWILYNVAMCAIVHNKWIKELYESYCARKESKMAVIGIIMHKILRIIYGMLKNKTNYNPDIDKANQNKIIKNRKNADQKLNKTRRYQQYDKDAPISKRKTKKRKEQEESQNDNIIKCGIITPAQIRNNINSIIQKGAISKNVKN